MIGTEKKMFIERLIFVVCMLLFFLSSLTDAASSPRIKFQRVYNDYPINIFEGQGTVMDVNGEKYLVVMGGFQNFPHITRRVYRRKLTLEKAKWERMSDMPSSITHMAQAVSGNLFCGAGGYWASHPGHSVSNVLCYDATRDYWWKLPNLPGDRAGGGLIIRGRTLIYAGGGDRAYNSLKLHIDHGDGWWLEIDKPWRNWRRIQKSMPDPRNHMGAVSTCGRLFWVGGQHGEDEVSGNRRSVSEFVPGAGIWRQATKLPYPLGHISASVMPYACGILVIAGVSRNKRRVTDVRWYSPKNRKWFHVGYYPFKVATPVCGIHKDTVMCATGGHWSIRNRVFIGKLFWPK